MDKSKRSLIDIDDSKEPPSRLLAKQLVEQFKRGVAGPIIKPETILDSYDDGGYAIDFSQLSKWLKPARAALVKDAFLSDQRTLEERDEDSDKLRKEMFAAFDSHQEKQIGDEELVEILAKHLSFLNETPFWNNAPYQKHWHVARVEAAHYQIHKIRSWLVDFVFDGIQMTLTEKISQLEAVRDGSPTQSTVEELQQIEEGYYGKLSDVEATLDDLVNLSLKAGFLFRDSWWLETHGDSALKGHQANETEIKAGAGGAKASSAARRKRINSFMLAYVDMLQKNPALRDDPENELAVRALKLARKQFPDMFRHTTSTKTAVEYLEYIKSDPEFKPEYDVLLSKINRLK